MKLLYDAFIVVFFIFYIYYFFFFFFFQAEDGIRDKLVTGVQTCALPICRGPNKWARVSHWAGVRCDASPIAVGMARRAVRAAPSGRAGRESLGRIRALPFDVQSSDS